MYISQQRRNILEAEESTLGDYGKVFNPIGMRVAHPDLYAAKGYEEDPSFNAWDKEKDFLFNDFDGDTEIDIRDSAVSEDHLQALIGRNKEYQKSLERISQDSTATQISLGLLTGVADPTVLIPVGGALNKVNTAIKGANTFAKIGAKAGTVGTVGALSAVGSEALMDVQGLPTHYLNATMYGFALGGGLSVVGDAISHAARPSTLMNKFKKDPLSESLPASPAQIISNNTTAKTSRVPIGVENTVDSVVGNVAGTSTSRNGVVPRVKQFVENKFFNFASSAERLLLGSKSDSARTLSAFLKRPFTSVGYKVPQSVEAFKNFLNGSAQTAHTALHNVWKGLKETGGFKGNYEQFTSVVGKDLAAKGAMQRKLVYSNPLFKTASNELSTIAEKIKVDRAEFKRLAKENNLGKDEIKAANTAFDDALESAQKAYNAKVDTLWESSLDKIQLNDAEKVLREYYQEMLRAGKEAGILEFKNISDFALYGGERRVNASAVRTMDEAEAKAMIRAAMEDHPLNADMKPGALTRKVNEFYNYAVKEDQIRDGANTLLGSMTGNVGRMGKRKFNLNDGMILPMLETSASQALHRYSMSMSGQIAMRQMFPELRGVGMYDTNKAFQSKIGKPLAKIITKEHGGDKALAKKDLDNLSYLVDGLLNNINVKSHSNNLSHRAQRTLSQIATLQYGAGFGMYNIFEQPAAMLASGFHKMFGAGIGKGFADVTKYIYANKNSDLVRHLQGIGKLMPTMHTNHMNRFTDTNLMFTHTGVEGAGQKMTDFMFKFTGMHLFQSMNEVSAAVRMADMIHNYKPGKYSNAKVNALLRAGLDEDDILKLQASMKKNKVMDERGIVNHLELDDPALQSKLDNAILNQIDDAVIQAGTDNIPKWVLELGPLGKVITTFWSFSFKAREKLLIKGMNENPAGLAAATLASTGLAMTYFYAIEQAEIASGAKSWADAQYDMSSQDGFTNLLQKGLMYSGPMAYPSFVYGLMNKAVVFGGGEGLPGAGFAPRQDAVGNFMLSVHHQNAEALAKLMNMAATGDLATPESRDAAYQLSLFQTVPILGNGLEALIKD